jgi:hypothetical protein
MAAMGWQRWARSGLAATAGLLLLCCASGQLGPDGAGTTDGAPARERNAEGGAVDADGDGHCAPGTSDPACQSLGDCDDDDKTRHPGAVETCADEGVDNDCDGDADEVDEDQDGTDDRLVPCASGLPGICHAGQRQCTAGQLSCLPVVEVGQQVESCNGEDDDCDGSTDEGQLCSNENSCDGQAGCRCQGAAPCAGAEHCCAEGCVDVSTSTSACGACAVACGPGESCNQGSCQCGSTMGTVGGGPACPAGGFCSAGTCVACDGTVNLALQATASSSGGGAGTGLEPDQMNNDLLEASCLFHWVYAVSTPGSSWIQLDWSGPVTVNNVWFDTAPASSGVCGMSAGRTLAGGTLQAWDGTAWVTLASVSGKTDDWSLSFQQTTTTKLRLYGVYAPSTGLAKNPMIFEWRVRCM